MSFDVDYCNDLPEYPQTSESGYTYIVATDARTNLKAVDIMRLVRADRASLLSVVNWSLTGIDPIFCEAEG